MAAPPTRIPLVSRILIAVAAVLVVLALLGAWADRQLMNGDDWATTSAALLGDEAIRVPLGDELAAELADGSRVGDAIRQAAPALPPRLMPLADAAAGAAAAASRETVRRAVQRVLASSGVQQAWVAATAAVQRQLVALIRDRDGRIAGGAVTLDLRPVAERVAQRIGASGQRIAALPPDRTRVELMPADRLTALQRIARGIDLLSWLPAIVALALMVAAGWLARGTRGAVRGVVLAAGASLVGAALFVLVLRRLGGHAIVAATTADGPLRPAAAATWRIATDLLADLATTTLIVGLVTAAGAWLAGPGPWARRARRRLEPWLVARPVAAGGAVALLYLALVAWGPLSVFVHAWPAIILAVLLGVGVWALRASMLAERAAAAGATPASGAPSSGAGDDSSPERP